MKTLHIRTVSLKSIVGIVRDVLAASKEDKVVRLQFTVEDYVTFSQRSFDLENICRVPDLFPFFCPFESRPLDHLKKTMTYDAIAKELLTLHGASPTIERYNTAQIIYRF